MGPNTVSPSSTSSTTAGASSSAAASPIPPEVKNAIDVEIMKSIKEFDLGNYDQAIELMDKACLMEGFCFLVHMMRSYLYNLIAYSTKNWVQKRRLLKIVANSATRASSLSPFNAFLLVHEALIYYHIAEFSMDTVGFHQVIDKCDFALRLPTAALIDPIKGFGNQILRQFSTSESRIEHSLQMLRYVRGNAICAKERLGDLAMVPIVVPNLLTINDGKGKQPSSSSSKTSQPGNGQQTQQTETSDQPKTKALNCLKSLSIKDRLDLHLYSVNVQELTEFVKQHKSDILSFEAVSVAAGKHPIKAFPCCLCHVAPFATADEHMGHIFEAHIGNLAQRLKDLMPEIDNEDMDKVLPKRASFDQIKSLTTTVWSPLDDPLVQRCPSTDASRAERAEFLNKIGRVFLMLEDQKILSDRHIDLVINWTKRCLEQSATQLQNDGVVDWIEFIPFLMAPQLKAILIFLEELWDSCEIDEINNTESSLNLNAVKGTQDARLLLFDPDWIILDFCEENPDALIDWLYDDSTRDYNHRAVWRRTLNKSRQFVEKLQTEFSIFCLVCKEKLRSLDAWSSLGKLSEVDNVGLEHLKKRQEELSDGSNSVELVAINEMIESTDQIKDEVMIWTKASQIYIQICKIDVRILSGQKRLAQLEQKIKQASAYDYKMALIQLVKSFLQMRLEVQITKDAKDKFDAEAP